MSDRVELLFSCFYDKPQIMERSTSSAYTKEVNKDISKFPFMTKNDIPFELRFTLKGKHAMLCKDTIPAGFTYNMADIPFILQPITYDKHSPYVKDASLLHDYLLKYKRELYAMWHLKDYGMTHKDFRILTSDVFEQILVQNGVPEKKAHTMRNAVDWFQKFFVWSWMGLK